MFVTSKYCSDCRKHCRNIVLTVKNFERMASHRSKSLSLSHLGAIHEIIKNLIKIDAEESMGIQNEKIKKLAKQKKNLARRMSKTQIELKTELFAGRSKIFDEFESSSASIDADENDVDSTEEVKETSVESGLESPIMARKVSVDLGFESGFETEPDDASDNSDSDNFETKLGIIPEDSHDINEKHEESDKMRNQQVFSHCISLPIENEQLHSPIDTQSKQSSEITVQPAQRKLKARKDLPSQETIDMKKRSFVRAVPSKSLEEDQNDQKYEGMTTLKKVVKDSQSDSKGSDQSLKVSLKRVQKQEKVCDRININRPELKPISKNEKNVKTKINQETQEIKRVDKNENHISCGKHSPTYKSTEVCQKTETTHKLTEVYKGKDTMHQSNEICKEKGKPKSFMPTDQLVLKLEVQNNTVCKDICTVTPQTINDTTSSNTLASSTFRSLKKMTVQEAFPAVREKEMLSVEPQFVRIKTPSQRSGPEIIHPEIRQEEVASLVQRKVPTSDRPPLSVVRRQSAPQLEMPQLRNFRMLESKAHNKKKPTENLFQVGLKSTKKPHPVQKIHSIDGSQCSPQSQKWNPRWRPTE